MKISAIFSDYDGTLAPDDVPLGASRMPRELEGPLMRLANSIPVAIVTAKDYAFVRPRTPFASAWACASGLEIVLADGRAVQSREASGSLLVGLEYVRRNWSSGIGFELKRSTNGRPLGFSVDWRGTAAPPRDLVKKATAHLVGLGLTVAHDSSNPFLDVFCSKPDKGRALRELKALLGVTGNVLFMGNSRDDNPAFDRADVSLCVEHGQELGRLKCGFVVGFGELGAFLDSLDRNGLSFDSNMLKKRR